MGFDPVIYSEAIVYASEMHRGQFRDGGMPYLIHPLRVAESLRQIGVDDGEILMAAVLHDVIEDTQAGYVDIQKRFGKRVADMVGKLSNDDRVPKKVKKAQMIEKMKTAPSEVKLVKMADRLDNLRDLRSWDEQQKVSYFDESRRLFEALSFEDEDPLADWLGIMSEKLGARIQEWFGD